MAVEDYQKGHQSSVISEISIHCTMMIGVATKAVVFKIWVMV